MNHKVTSFGQLFFFEKERIRKGASVKKIIPMKIPIDLLKKS